MGKSKRGWTSENRTQCQNTLNLKFHWNKSAPEYGGDFCFAASQHSTNFVTRFTKFTSIVKKNCDHNTNAVATGTISCYDSILARTIIEKEQPGWISKRYGAVQSWAKNLKLWNEWKSIYEGQWSYSNEKGRSAARKFFEDHKEAMLALLIKRGVG